jgi:hypothetical protein
MATRSKPWTVGLPLVALVLLLSSNPAHAQPADLAAAETLFEQGRTLLAAGNVEEACAKFAESHRLAPAAGTALNLGSCYEKQKKTASAWGAFQEALALSQGTGQSERAQLARDRAAALEPRLARLIVTVLPANNTPDLEVRRDGVLMTRAQFGTAIPVDAGSHVIEAKAPSKVPYRKTIEISVEGSTTNVALPLLEDAPNEPMTAPPPAETTSGGGGSGGTLRVVGIGTLILGVGLIGTGTVFALSSSSKRDELEEHARSGGSWGPDQSTKFDDGESAATIANVLFVSGAVALVAGGVLTVLGFTAKKPSSTTAVVPTMGGLKCAF